MEKCQQCGQKVEHTEMIDYVARCEACTRALIAERMESPIPCPLDGTTMTKLEKSGVIVDQCPKCHGLWLDEGELELIQEATRKEHELLLKSGRWL